MRPHAPVAIAIAVLLVLQLLTATVGIVFQSVHLVMGLCALANGSLTAAFLSAAPIDEALAQTALARVGLGDKAQRLPSQLSGGLRQRVAIARLFNAPKVLFCDAATGNLGAQTAAEVISLFQSLNAPGLTTLAMRTLSLAEGRLK